MFSRRRREHEPTRWYRLTDTPEVFSALRDVPDDRPLLPTVGPSMVPVRHYVPVQYGVVPTNWWTGGSDISAPAQPYNYHPHPATAQWASFSSAETLMRPIAPQPPTASYRGDQEGLLQQRAAWQMQPLPSGPPPDTVYPTSTPAIRGPGYQPAGPLWQQPQGVVVDDFWGRAASRLGPPALGSGVGGRGPREGLAPVAAAASVAAVELGGAAALGTAGAIAPYYDYSNGDDWSAVRPPQRAWNSPAGPIGNNFSEQPVQLDVVSQSNANGHYARFGTTGDQEAAAHAASGDKYVDSMECARPAGTTGVTAIQQWLLLVPDHSKMALAKAWSTSVRRAAAAAPSSMDELGVRTVVRHPVTSAQQQPYLANLLPVDTNALVSPATARMTPELVLQYTNRLYGEAWVKPSGQQDTLTAASSALYWPVVQLPTGARHDVGVAGAAPTPGNRNNAVSGTQRLYNMYNIFLGQASNNPVHFATALTANHGVDHANAVKAAVARDTTPSPLARMPYMPDLMEHVARSGSDAFAPSARLIMQCVPKAAIWQAAWAAHQRTADQKAAVRIPTKEVLPDLSSTLPSKQLSVGGSSTGGNIGTDGKATGLTYPPPPESRWQDRQRMMSVLAPVFTVDLDISQVTITYINNHGRSEVETQTDRRQLNPEGSGSVSDQSSAMGSGTDLSAGSSSLTDVTDTSSDSMNNVSSSAGDHDDSVMIGAPAEGRFMRLLRRMNIFRHWHQHDEMGRGKEHHEHTTAGSSKATAGNGLQAGRGGEQQMASTTEDLPETVRSSEDMESTLERNKPAGAAVKKVKGRTKKKTATAAARSGAAGDGDVVASAPDLQEAKLVSQHQHKEKPAALAKHQKSMGKTKKHKKGKPAPQAPDGLLVTTGSVQQVNDVAAAEDSLSGHSHTMATTTIIAADGSALMDAGSVSGDGPELESGGVAGSHPKAKVSFFHKWRFWKKSGRKLAKQARAGDLETGMEPAENSVPRGEEMGRPREEAVASDGVSSTPLTSEKANEHGQGTATVALNKASKLRGASSVKIDNMPAQDDSSLAQLNMKDNNTAAGDLGVVTSDPGQGEDNLETAQGAPMAGGDSVPAFDDGDGHNKDDGGDVEDDGGSPTSMDQPHTNTGSAPTTGHGEVLMKKSSPTWLQRIQNAIAIPKPGWLQRVKHTSNVSEQQLDKGKFRQTKHSQGHHGNHIEASGPNDAGPSANGMKMAGSMEGTARSMADTAGLAVEAARSGAADEGRSSDAALQRSSSMQSHPKLEEGGADPAADASQRDNSLNQVGSMSKGKSGFGGFWGRMFGRREHSSNAEGGSHQQQSQLISTSPKTPDTKQITSPKRETQDLAPVGAQKPVSTQVGVSATGDQKRQPQQQPITSGQQDVDIVAKSVSATVTGVPGDNDNDTLARTDATRHSLVGDTSEQHQLSPGTTDLQKPGTAANTEIEAIASSEMEDVESKVEPGPGVVAAGTNKGTKGKNAKGKKAAGKQGARAVSAASPLPLPPPHGPKAKLMQKLLKLSDVVNAQRAASKGSPPISQRSSITTVKEVAAGVVDDGVEQLPPEQNILANSSGLLSMNEEQAVDQPASIPFMSSGEQKGGDEDQEPAATLGTGSSVAPKVKSHALERLKNTLARTRARHRSNQQASGTEDNASSTAAHSISHGGDDEDDQTASPSGHPTTTTTGDKGDSSSADPVMWGTQRVTRSEAGSESSKQGGSGKISMMGRMMASLRRPRHQNEVQEIVTFKEVQEPKGFGSTVRQSAEPASPARAAAQQPSTSSRLAESTFPRRTSSSASSHQQQSDGLNRTSKASRLSLTARSDLGAQFSGRQAQGENLMASIRAQKGAEQHEGNPSPTSKDQPSPGNASGGWAAQSIQSGVGVVSTPNSPLMQSLMRSTLNKTATMVRGHDVMASPGGSLFTSLKETIREEDGEGEDLDKSAAVTMAKQLVDLGLPPSKW